MRKIYFLALLTCFGAYASPSGFKSQSASYTVDRSGTHVIQSGSKAIAEWKEFSLAKGETVQFLQKDSQSAILNRVTGGSLIKIHGHIQSNGNVLFVNRAGVIIGREATIQCAGFLASTAHIPDDAFLNGEMIALSNFGAGKITNLGVIDCPEGVVALLANEVDNRGVIHGEVLVKTEGPILIQTSLGSLSQSNNLYSLAVKKEEGLSQELLEEDGKLFLTSSKSAMMMMGTASASEGILITGGTISTTSGGSISLNGTGHSSGSSNHGVRISDGILSTTGSGGLTIEGTGSAAGSSLSTGVFVTGTGLTDISTVNGALAITGEGGTGGTINNIGVRVDTVNTTIETTGTGTISITGTGRGSSSTNPGILLIDGIMISSASNTLAMTGTGSASGTTSSQGIQINGGPTISSTSGNVTLTGTGQGSGSGNQGVFCSGIGIDILSTSGTISLNGTSLGTSSPNEGVRIEASSNIDSTNGRVNITGMRSSISGNENHGILVTGITTISGAASFIGQSLASGDENTGITISSSAMVSGSTATPFVLRGVGGVGGTSNYGVAIEDPATAVTSTTRALQIIGEGGVGSNDGVFITRATVSATPSLSIQALSDIVIEESATVSSLGPLTLDASRDVIISGGTVLATNTTVSSAGDALLIAGRNLSLLDGTTSVAEVDSSANLTFVVDNSFPTFPSRGPGAFTAEPTALVTASGELRVYTVQQSQNTIDAFLNGATFTPGPFDVDTNTEKWVLYFSDGPYGGPNFTIYYKIGTFLSEVLASDRAISELVDFEPVVHFGQLPGTGFNGPSIYHGHFSPGPPRFAPYRAFIFEDDIYWTNEDL